MVFLLCRQEVCAVFAQNFIEQERLQDDVILGLLFTLCRFEGVPTTLQLSQKIGFLGQVTQMFLGWFLGCSVSLQKCMVETAAGFCASHLHRINIIFMPSSVEVAKSFVSWLQIWDDWLGVGFLVGAISVSIWSIYLFVIFLVLFIVLFIYLLNWLIFYLQHTHTSIYILIYFMHNHMTNTHTHAFTGPWSFYTWDHPRTF